MDREDKREIMKVLSALFAVIALATIGQIFVSCSPRICPPAEVKDSVVVLIRDRVVHDSVPYIVPVIKEVNVTRDTLSHLENQYASSDASVTDGILRHSLETRPQTIYVPYTVEVHDTTIVEKEAETIIREVEKEPAKAQTFFQVFGLIAFATLWSAIVLAGIHWIKKA